MVNRVWGMLFGQPIVATPSNFGHSGVPPTNPELLDDLAVRFMDRMAGRSSRWCGEIVLRRRTGSQRESMQAKAAIDPANELLWRMNRRRLTIEQWRDVVAVRQRGAGTGGGQVAWSWTTPANLRRTVYARISRLKLNDLLMQFDYPDANVHAEKRAVTITADAEAVRAEQPVHAARERRRWRHGSRRTRETDGRDAGRRGRTGCCSRASRRRRR